MSLLLDALKKAAEQKAEKSRAEDRPEISATTGDEADLSAVEAEGELSTSDILAEDETDIDLSDYGERLARVSEQAGEVEDTSVDISGPTDSEIAALSQQMETGEDESIIFADDDISEFMGDPRFINTAPAETTNLDDEDQTEQLPEDPDPAVASEDTEVTHSQLAADDTEVTHSEPASEDTEITHSQPASEDTEVTHSQPASEDTEVTHSELAPDDSEVTYSDSAADDTEITQSEVVETAANLSLQPTDSSDDTDLTQPETAAVADEGELALMPEPDLVDMEQTSSDMDGARDDTDMSHVEAPADAGLGGSELALEPMDSGADQTGVEDDPSVVLMQDEDLSLLLRDDDTTAGSTVTSITEERTDQSNLLRNDASYTLSLVDSGEEKPVNPDQTATVSSTATTGVALDTLTTEGITTRAEATSTRTYAPDNYDRTLMKLPGDDASNLFAGMKSDSDVVMTPEYAKKVFQSKSNSHRFQHFKVYGGLIFTILLGIAVYGIYEIDHESTSIEKSLQVLKRDPMPVIKKPVEEKEKGLFEDTGIDEQTIKLVESASDGTGASIAAAGGQPGSDEVVAEVSPEPSESSELDELVETQGVEVFGTIADESETVPAPLEQPALASSTAIQELRQPVAVPDTAQAQPGSETSGRSSLQLSTSSQLGEEHVLLREAYTAYRAGNDQLALQKYNEVLQKYPTNRNALLARAAINVQNNDVAAAISDYRELLLANPKDTLAMTSLIAVANVSPSDAETQLKLMIRDEPDSPYLNFALANAYGAQDRWREAQSHYFTALENNPLDPNYAYNLAVSLEHIAKPQVAVSYYQRALDNMGNGLAMFSKDIVDQRLEILGKL